MQSEHIDIESIIKERREAVEESIEIISAKELRNSKRIFSRIRCIHGPNRSNDLLRRTVETPSTTPALRIMSKSSIAVRRNKVFGSFRAWGLGFFSQRLWKYSERLLI